MEPINSVDLRLKSPFTAMIAAGTGSGKTWLMKRLIDGSNEVCTHPPEEILYCYGAWQPLFEEMTGVTFHEGLIDFGADVKKDGKHRWIIIDDLMEKAKANEDIKSLFTKYSHHYNISVFFLVQNLFAKELRTISLNTHYFFIFKNPRDSSNIIHLAKQLYPGNVNFLVESYRDATIKPFSYLLIDMKQNTDDRLRVIGNFMSRNNETMIAYQSN